MQNLSHLLSYKNKVAELIERRKNFDVQKPGYIEAALMKWHDLLLNETSLNNDAANDSSEYAEPQTDTPLASNNNVNVEYEFLNEEWSMVSTEKYLHAIGAAMPEF